jgi:hypothetical protein
MHQRYIGQAIPVHGYTSPAVTDKWRANQKPRSGSREEMRRDERKCRSTYLFASSAESLDHFAIQSQRKRCFRSRIWARGRVSRSVWSHGFGCEVRAFVFFLTRSSLIEMIRLRARNDRLR